MKPKILITNDDGIQAPGIRALWMALKDFCDCTVIAPHSDQSGTGLSITVRAPLRVKKHLWEEGTAWSVSGTPADSVKMALSALLDDKPDLIVSGINKGSNTGRTILYSGTVSAAIEGAIQGIPAIAFSCWDFVEPDYSLASPWVEEIVQYVIERKLPESTLLNVNFPAKRMSPYKGIKLSKQGKGYWKEKPNSRVHPSEGHPYWWLGLEHADYEEDAESDVSHTMDGWVSAVPLFVGDLTHEKLRLTEKTHFESAFRLKVPGIPQLSEAG